jgi:hypothetical protein
MPREDLTRLLAWNQGRPMRSSRLAGHHMKVNDRQHSAADGALSSAIRSANGRD